MVNKHETKDCIFFSMFYVIYQIICSAPDNGQSASWDIISDHLDALRKCSLKNSKIMNGLQSWLKLILFIFKHY